jgi:23S rRNA (cytosine1962-C5)-methyltransferase
MKMRLLEAPEEVENGALVDVFGKKQNYLGTGFYSAQSKIRIRLLGNNANEKYDDAFFQRKVKYASGLPPDSDGR